MYFSKKYNEWRVCNILHHFTVNLTKSALTDMKLDLVKASLSLVTFSCQSQFPLGLNLLCLETTLTSEKSSSRGTEKGVKARTAQAQRWAVKLSAITSTRARAHSTKLSPGPSLSGGLYKSQGHQKAVATKSVAFCLKWKSCYITLFPHKKQL